MKALRRTAPTVAELTDVEQPEPRDGEVLVKMAHAAVNPFDLQVLRGEIGADTARVLTLGAEGVGTVDGRLVQVSGGGLGVGRDGTFAPWVLAPSSAVRPLPEGADPRRSATVGVAGKTAWRTVHQLAGVTSDDVVLVLGASGGVGIFAAQLARAAGARVLAHTASDTKAARLAELGLEPVTAATAVELVAALAGTGVSVVLDPLGGDYSAALLPHLALGARIVSYGVLAGRTASIDLGVLYSRGLTLRGTSGGTTPEAESEQALAGALDAVLTGAVRVDVESVPLAEAPRALRRLTERTVTGKLVLDV